MSDDQLNTGPAQQSEGAHRYQHQYEGHLPVPNSTEVLVLGILTIVFCWCYGIISVILGIIALVMASEGEKKFRNNPNLYSLSSYKNLRAGRTCAIVGLCISILSVVIVIIYLVWFGTMLFNLPTIDPY
jgi:uncharacterized membrane protein